MEHVSKNRVEAFERALKEGSRKRYVLHLFVTGSTPKSLRAIMNIRKICEEHLEGRYDLEVIDIYQQPGRARENGIIASPTLVRRLPVPRRMFIGDLSDADHVLARMGITPRIRHGHGDEQENGI